MGLGKIDERLNPWMSDEEYLAYARAQEERSADVPANAPAPVNGTVAPRASLDCPRCARRVESPPEPPIRDALDRLWHRDCARAAAAQVASPFPRDRCPGCGHATPPRGFLFDGACRKWHVDEGCASRALAGL